MTPTNEAPVTVEQADAEVARIMAMSDDEIMREADAGDVAWALGFKMGLASGKSAALASAPAGDGPWQAVPTEATEAMCEAGWQYADRRDAVLCLGEIRDLYAAMLGAAPAAIARPHSAVAPAGDGVEDRDAIAAAVANFDDMAAFRDWAANHSTYPNAYKSSVDRTYAIADRVAAALARPHSAVAPAGDGEPFTGVEAWDELVNVDDRTSPEEYPDMCLITRDELIGFMQRAAGQAIERHVRDALNDSEELADGSVNITADHARRLNADVDAWEAAALARPHSAVAPAGDGVEEARAIILRHSEKWVAEYAEREGGLPDTMVFRLPFVEKLLAEALARPRAAVGEMEA